MADAGISDIKIYGGGLFARSGPYQAIRRINDKYEYFEFRDNEAPTSCGSDHGKIAEIDRNELTIRGITNQEEEYSAVFALGLVHNERWKK